jgi:hypothetical protein
VVSLVVSVNPSIAHLLLRIQKFKKNLIITLVGRDEGCWQEDQLKVDILCKQKALEPPVALSTCCSQVNKNCLIFHKIQTTISEP